MPIGNDRCLRFVLSRPAIDNVKWGAMILDMDRRHCPQRGNKIKGKDDTATLVSKTNITKIESAKDKRFGR